MDRLRTKSDANVHWFFVALISFVFFDGISYTP